jgi:hypothetical protein
MSEPKIKYYLEMAGIPGQARAEVERALNEFAVGFVDELLKPQANGLQRPT